MKPSPPSTGPPQTIEVRDLCKSYDGKLVVDHLSFTVQPGVVTGFLGPNGAGKSTTMRLIVGLDRPTAGVATIGGVHYADLPRPLRAVGALLDAGAAHKGRSAFDHLLYLTQTQRIARSRVDEVLDLVGLHDVAHERVGGFSLGMGQRLGLAAALIGDPQVLILDEPVNGLDPDGIMWIRKLVIHLAGQGRTVLVSSHLMSEMAATATDLVVIGRGRLIAACTTDEFVERSSKRSVLVKSPDGVALTDLIITAGGQVDVGADGDLIVRLLDAAHIGALASTAGLELHELTPQLASLEDAFMEQTHTSNEFGGQGADADAEADREPVAAGSSAGARS
jgi:ABC-2 type transport system ATP-binding protein